MADVSGIVAGQRVWCRSAAGTWVEFTAAGPVGRSIGRPSWPAVPVLGWYRDKPETPVNWPVEDVRTEPPWHPSHQVQLDAVPGRTDVYFCGRCARHVWGAARGVTDAGERPCVPHGNDREPA